MEEKIIYFERNKIPTPKKYTGSIGRWTVRQHPNYQREVENLEWYAERGLEYHSEILDADERWRNHQYSQALGRTFNTRYYDESPDWEYYRTWSE